MTLPGTLTNPPLAVGLAGLLDWSTAQPLLDHFKLARPWTGTVGGRFGALSFDDLRAQGVIDPQGWPLAVPEGVEAVSTVLLTELHAGAQDLAGRYLLTWRGEGEIALKGATAQAPQDGGIAFDFRPDPQRALGLDITRITRGPIRDIRVVQLDNLSRHRDGQLFRREWLDRVRNYRLLRFMDWMFTNNSVQAEWADRPRPEDAFYTWRGAPVEVMVAALNEVGADGWFCVPHLASADWLRRFATVVRDGLSPGLRAWYEYSNEMWNMQFGQTQWAIEQARGLWPAQGDGFMQLYAARSVAMAEELDRIHAADPGRCVKVISTHTHWLGLEGAALDAPDWRADHPLKPPPYRHFDAYAVSGYFDGGIDRAENVPAIRALLEQGEAAARTALRDQMLHGGWPESGRTIASLRQTWDYHAEIARRRGLALVMYEGGSHITPPAPALADPALAEFYQRFNYSAEMGQVYTAALDEWAAAGGSQFNQFVECDRPSPFGYWGLQRHLGDENPRWAAVDTWNRGHQGQDGRGGSDFIGGYEMDNNSSGG